MWPVSRPSHASPRRHAPYRGWLAALLIAAAVALLVPGIRWATASHSTVTSQASLAGDVSRTGMTTASCRGVTPATFPPQGFITGPAHTQGGHMWWRSMGTAGVCVGTVVEKVWYTTAATKTWKVIVYSAAHPGGQTVAHATFTLPRGFYLWSFRIRRAFPGLSAVCITADLSFGASCVNLG